MSSTLQTPRQSHHFSHTTPLHEPHEPKHSTLEIKVPSYPTPSLTESHPFKPRLLTSPISTSKSHQRSSNNPSLVVICVICHQSVAWFKPPSHPHLSSTPTSSLSQSEAEIDSSVQEDHVIDIHSSTSSLIHSQLPTPNQTLDQIHSDSILHPSSSACSASQPSPLSNSDPTNPLWFSGQIHALCSQCHQLSSLGSSSYQSNDEDLLLPSSRPHPMSFFSDVTPLSASSGSSGFFPSPSPSIHHDHHHGANVHDDQSQSSSDSSLRSASVGSVQPFRLSIVDGLPPCREVQIQSQKTLNQLEILKTSEAVFRLELPTSRQKKSFPTLNRHLPQSESSTSSISGSHSEALISSDKFVDHNPLSPIQESRLSSLQFIQVGDSKEILGTDLQPSHSTQSRLEKHQAISLPLKRAPSNASAERRQKPIAGHHHPAHSLDRAASLRSLLRQAKIPSFPSDQSSSGLHRRNVSDVWQAALIGTPRDPRDAALPSWQSYIHTGSEERVHHHLRASSSTGHGLPARSPAHSKSISQHSISHSLEGSVEHSAYHPHHVHSPISHRTDEGLSSAPLAGGTALERLLSLRRPSFSNSTTQANLTAPIPSTLLAHHPTGRPSFQAERSIHRPHRNPPSPLPRQASSHGLFGRFTDRVREEVQPRPSTATGSLTNFFSFKSPPPPSRPTTTSPSVSPPSAPPTTHKHLFAAITKRPATATTAVPAASSPPSSFTPSPQPRRPTTALPSRAPSRLVTSNATQPNPSTSNVTQPNPSGVSAHRAPSTEVQRVTSSDQSLPPRAPSRSVPVTPTTQAFHSSPWKKSSERSPSSSASDASHKPSVGPSPKLSSKTSSKSASKSSTIFVSGVLPTTFTDELSQTGYIPSLTTEPNPAIRPHRSFAKLPPEDFYSKSRHLTLSVFPRPSSDTFRPGQTLTLYVRRPPSTNSKKKYGAIGIVLSGRLVERSNGMSHEFLKIVKSISGGVASAEVKPIGNSEDEWSLNLEIPEYATCSCCPGPLPLPSAGSSLLGEVDYTIQLMAEKKQLITSQETITVKFHLTAADDRGVGAQLTTRPVSVRSTRGRIPFGAGHLGSIEEYSLSHQIYFVHPERVEIFYAFEVRLGAHSNLPKSMIDHLASSTKVSLKNLLGDDRGTMRGVVDHRSPGWTPTMNGWVIKGSVEVTDVFGESRGDLGLSSSTGKMTTSVRSRSRRREEERLVQSHKINQQLFLIVKVEEGSGSGGILAGQKLELSALIGPGVFSNCVLRRLGLRERSLGLGSR